MLSSGFPSPAYLLYQSSFPSFHTWEVWGWLMPHTLTLPVIRAGISWITGIF